MFVNQKAQEISYAVVRVAAYIRRQELRQRLERLSLQLLEEVAGGSLELGIKTCSSLESLINLGKAIYEVEPINAKVILGELASLNEAMRQIAGLEQLPNLDSVFSKPPAVFGEVQNSQESGNGNGSNGINASIRQSAILEKIRQSENRQAPLKDIIAAFPDISERTMRYDLQKLCLQGLLERMGNGGPGSYYVLRS